jgi:hypothetical protein
MRSAWLCLVALASIVVTSTSNAAVIPYDAVEESGATWRYDYSVTNSTLGGAIDELTLYFPLGQYSNLSVSGAPSGWNSIVAQPDPNLPADGFYDSVALSSGLGSGQTLSGFSATFTWLGAGTPGAQSFDIIDPNTFATLESGRTVPAPVPLPPSGIMMLVGLGTLTIILSKQRSTRSSGAMYGALFG